MDVVLGQQSDGVDRGAVDPDFVVQVCAAGAGGDDVAGVAGAADGLAGVDGLTDVNESLREVRVVHLDCGVGGVADDDQVAVAVVAAAASEGFAADHGAGVAAGDGGAG